MKYSLNTQLKDKLNILLYHGVTDKPNEELLIIRVSILMKMTFCFKWSLLKKDVHHSV